MIIKATHTVTIDTELPGAEPLFALAAEMLAEVADIDATVCINAPESGTHWLFRTERP